MHRLLSLLLLGLSILFHGQPVRSAEPLHVRIDQLISRTGIGPQARLANDEEFLRRVYLDLTGQIPAISDARAFLADKAPDKRAKLVDRLLSTPQYERHMTDSLHIMLMERRTNDKAWLAWLQAAIAANKPWNEMAAEILSTDGSDAKNRGPIQYFTARSVEPNLMTREVSRIFFGMDVQCAQCHNHPLIDDYLQEDYYGVFAFLSRTYLFQPDKKKPAVLAEKAEGEAKFKSVFTGNEGNTRPRLPGDQEISEPTYEKGEEYQVKADKKNKNIRPIPKYSRRQRLGEVVAKGTNQAFRRNIVNRLWLQMMGRGLVHPPDLHHSDNPASHPELLDVLASDFAAMKFDIKAFLRELALTETYQRAVTLPDEVANAAAKIQPRLAELKAEKGKLDAAVAALEKVESELDAKQEAAQKSKLAVDAELAKATAAVTAAGKAIDPLSKARMEAEKVLVAKQVPVKPLAETLAKAEESLKLLPGDKELTEIVTRLQGRVLKLNREIAPLAKAAADRVAAHTAATGKLATAEKNAAQVAARQATINQQLASIDQQSRSNLGALRAQRASALVADRRVDTVKALISYSKRLETARASLAAAQKVLVQFTPLKRDSDAAKVDLQTNQQQLAAIKADFDKAAQRLQQIQAELQKKPALATAVAEASSKVAVAQQLDTADAELKKIADALAAKAKALSDQVAVLKKEMPGVQSQATAGQQKIAKLQQTIAELTTRKAALETRLTPIAKQLEPLKTKADKDQEALDEAYDQLTSYWSEQFVIGALEPLSPEQMAWSVMQATGLVDNQRAAATAEINKKKPLKPEDLKDPAKVAARQREIELAVQAKLQGNLKTFVSLFGASAGQPQYDFFATAEQALFFANGGQVRSWLSPRGSNLTARLLKIKEPAKLAEELYLSVLTRHPTVEEVTDVEQHLSARGKDKTSAAVQEMAWALMSSSEFRFHH